MKCNDCIYEKMCEARYEREHCFSFKDKANFVEVVRCKDCVWWHTKGCAFKGDCTDDLPSAEDFCSQATLKKVVK